MQNYSEIAGLSAKDHNVINDFTAESIYQAGYSTIRVKSIFDKKRAFSDLLCNILLQKNDCFNMRENG